MRATADNFSLAEVRGISTELVIALTWLYCGALLGLTGVLAGLDLVIEPLIGWNLTIPIFAAAILGGIGSPYGAMLGAVLVGLAEEFTVLILPSTYKVGGRLRHHHPPAAVSPAGSLRRSAGEELGP